MSSVTWQAVHRRSAAVRDLVARLDRGEALPADPAPFEGVEDRLRALHELWSRRLACRVDVALELGDSVAAAWHLAEDDLPGVRRELDRHQHLPWLTRLDQVALRSVAVAAARATWADPLPVSAAAGARVVGARSVPLAVSA